MLEKQSGEVSAMNWCDYRRSPRARERSSGVDGSYYRAGAKLGGILTPT